MTTPHTDAAAILHAALEAQSLATALARSHLAKFRSLIAGRYNQAAVNHNKPELATAYKELLHALDQIEAEPADLPRAAKSKEQTYAVPVSKFPPVALPKVATWDTPLTHQVGEGFRLLDDDEKIQMNLSPEVVIEKWEYRYELSGWKWTAKNCAGQAWRGSSPGDIYRTRASRSELRKARGLPPEK